MNKFFYITLLAAGLAACNGTTGNQNQQAAQPTESAVTDSNSTTNTPATAKKELTQGAITARIGSDGQVSIQIDKAHSADDGAPNRLGNAPRTIEGFAHKCTDILFFGEEKTPLLGMLTEEGGVAILDLNKSTATGDMQCSGILPGLTAANTIKIEEERLIAYTADGTEHLVQAFDSPGYYMHGDFEIVLTRDYRISLLTSPNGTAKTGTFFPDKERIADGPESRNQVLVTTINGKQYDISFGFDHFGLTENDEKRDDYTFAFDTDYFGLAKDSNITFKHYDNSQIAD